MRGRCAGCGKEDASCKVIKNHVMNCPEFKALLKATPEAALDPEKEYQRFKLEEGSREAKAAGKDTRIANNRATAMARHNKQTDRWKKRTS